MSNLVDFAKRELEAQGLFGDKDFYGGMTGSAVLELVEVFAKQGHSGMSAGLVLSLFERVADFELLGPLTGEDGEWNQIVEGDDPEWQNNRCSHVFKGKDGIAYDIDAVIFREPNGGCYTSHESRRNVTFPYTPKREYVDVHGDREAT